MTLRYLLTAAALALASLTAPAADPPDVIIPPDEKPKNVVEYDQVKSADVPWHVRMVRAPDAWAKNPASRGKGIKVAILDTGCQCDHPALEGRVTATYNAFTGKTGTAAVADGNSHGTHCAGGVHSIAPDADLIIVKVLSDEGSGPTDVIARGIDWATQNGADVISMSLGGSGRDDQQPPAVQRAIDAGVIVVAAAGNSGGGPNRDTEGYPGRLPGVISVAACDKDRNLAGFSSWGPNVTTTDPGVDVTGPLPGNKQGEMSGTSMATPLEAGKAAGWVATAGGVKDKTRASRFRTALIAVSPFPERTNARGYGLYSEDKAVPEGLAPKPDPAKPPVPEKVFTVNLADLQRQGYTAVRFDLGGTTPAAQPIPVQSVPAAPQPQPAVWSSQPVPVGQPPCSGPWCPGTITPQPWAVPQPMPAPPVQPRQFAPQLFSPPIFGGGCVGGACPR